jgi:hypothetical protein
MKLHEIRGKRNPDYDDTPDNPVTLTVTAPDALGDEIKVDVSYHATEGYEASHDDPGSPGDLDIKKIVLHADTKEYDDDGEVVKTWPKGTNVDKIDAWTGKYDTSVDAALVKYLNKF